MTLSFEDIPISESPLRRLDPRWKLAGVGLAVFAVALLEGVHASSLALTGAFAFAVLGRVPPRWYLGRLLALAPFLILFVVLLPFLVPSEAPLAAWGPVTFSANGLWLALRIGMKAVTIVTLVLVLLISAPLQDLLHAAQSLRVPGLLVQITLLAYRYLFLLAAEMKRTRIALRTRAYRNRMSLHSYRTIAHMAGATLIRSQERAERVAQAMRCRGFDGRFRSLAEFRTTWPDVCFFLTMVSIAAGLLAW